MKNVAPALAASAFLILIYSLLPLGTAFQFGGDEGFALIRAFMYNKGYKLYEQIWTDQPPLFTVLLASAFRTFGTSILTARLLAAAFGLLLVAVFHELVRARSGRWAALISSFLLAACPNVLLLMVSVMLEVPAFATGLLAAWLLFQYCRRGPKAWLVASGIVMGLALQIKFVAILV